MLSSSFESEDKAVKIKVLVKIYEKNEKNYLQHKKPLCKNQNWNDRLEMIDAFL
jgi:hypothetical protein